MYRKFRCRARSLELLRVSHLQGKREKGKKGKKSGVPKNNDDETEDETQTDPFILLPVPNINTTIIAAVFPSHIILRSI